MRFGRSINEGIAPDKYPGKGVHKASGALVKYKSFVDDLGCQRVTIVQPGEPMTQFTDMAELKKGYHLYTQKGMTK